jgi:hypothetical protein
MGGCVSIDKAIGAVTGGDGAGVTSTGLSIADGVGGAVGAGGEEVFEVATEGGGGWGATGIGVSVDAGVMIGGSGMGDCD